ncbi:hypothetical protein [Streptomyces angustmyceticus]|uniref:hypothetical protein n=1 Tax=Streptomyces angustmyceticus TaxID=285578 RepID=UPI003D9267B3
MTTAGSSRACVPTYRSLPELAVLEPQEHAYELADWIERIPATSHPSQRQVLDSAYSWLRLTSGLRSVSFDMAFDDGGMCGGGDFDLVWSEMMAEWQLHQIRLGYAAAAVEALVRALQLPAATVESAIEGAEADLGVLTPPAHAVSVAQHLLQHHRPASTGTSLSAGVGAAMDLRDRAARGELHIPEPEEHEMGFLATGQDIVCASREATSSLLIGGQVLLAWAVEKEVIQPPNEHKYLIDGMWMQDSMGKAVWVDDEIPYGDYLAFLHLEHGEPPVS